MRLRHFAHLAVSFIFIVAFTGGAFALDVTVPDEFLEYDIETLGTPADGYNYMTPAARYEGERDRYGYAVIMDNDGNIVYYKKAPEHQYYYNFTPYPELGLMAYCNRTIDPSMYFIMDQTYTLIDSIRPAEGHPLDNHELLIFGEGQDRTYWLIGDDERPVDMSEIVDGGDPDAIVLGMTIQELDADHNLVWEWKSLDHTDEVPITDAANYRDLTEDYIDYLHTNAIEIDTDGNVMMSQRGTSEITKVNYETQGVMWRWGGGLGNQFDFINDLEGQDSAFYLQHDIRRLENGNLTVFDNGSMRDTPKSFAKEYTVDEDELTATLVWSYCQDPPSHSGARGGHRVLENGNHLIGWGTNKSNDVYLTEVDPAGSKVWELTFLPAPGDEQVTDYRGFRTTMIGTAAVPYVSYELNDQTLRLYCNWFGHEDEVASYNVYFAETADPTEVHGNTDTGVYEITDLEYETDYYVRIKAVDDGDTEISDFSNQLIITPLSDVGEREATEVPGEFALGQNYPNPFNPTTSLKMNVPVTSRLTMKVYDVLGREIAELHNGTINAGRHTFTFNGENLASGVYFVRANVPGEFSAVRKIVLMK